MMARHPRRSVREAPVLATALFERFASRGEAEFANRLLSAMRLEFGGHVERKTYQESSK